MNVKYLNKCVLLNQKDYNIPDELLNLAYKDLKQIKEVLDHIKELKQHEPNENQLQLFS